MANSVSLAPELRFRLARAGRADASEKARRPQTEAFTAVERFSVARPRLKGGAQRSAV